MKGIVHSFQSCKEKLWELKDKVKGKMKKPQEGYQPANELFMEIEMVCRQIEQVEACFQMTSDEDLLDSCIYQMESLHARYRYLMKKAKDAGFSREPFLPRLLPLNCES